MVYLHSKDILHGDLAARNILLRRLDDRIQACVADFGLASQLQQGSTTMAVSRAFPVRWSAPEVLQATGRGHVYKKPSDVWALGVVFYEIHSMGTLPYHDLKNNDEVVAYVLVQRRVLPQPKGCPNQDYSILKRCWTYTPEQRPTSSEVLGLLDLLGVGERRKSALV